MKEKRKKGVRNHIPKENHGIFQVILCFHQNKTDQHSNLKKFNLGQFIKDHDKQLYSHLVKIREELKSLNIKVYLGDPDEEMETALNKDSKNKYIGYVIMNRSPRLGPSDPLPKDRKAWLTLAKGFKTTPKLRSLFKYIEKNYIHYEKIKGQRAVKGK